MGTVTHVKNELVTVTQLNQEAGGGLLEPRHRYPGSAGDDAHLVGLQLFSTGVVDVVLRVGFGGRPLGLWIFRLHWLEI